MIGPAPCFTAPAPFHSALTLMLGPLPGCIHSRPPLTVARTDSDIEQLVRRSDPTTVSWLRPQSPLPGTHCQLFFQGHLSFPGFSPTCTPVIGEATPQANIAPRCRRLDASTCLTSFLGCKYHDSQVARVHLGFPVLFGDFPSMVIIIIAWFSCPVSRVTHMAPNMRLEVHFRTHY
jgi:hypothetical protein